MHDVELSKGRGRRGAPLTRRGHHLYIASATVRRAPAVKSKSTLGSETPMVIDLSPKYAKLGCSPAPGGIVLQADHTRDTPCKTRFVRQRTATSPVRASFGSLMVQTDRCDTYWGVIITRCLLTPPTRPKIKRIPIISSIILCRGRPEDSTRTRSRRPPCGACSPRGRARANRRTSRP